jgi:hypothetical protein
MVNRYWQECIDNIDSFTYQIVIPVSSDDFKEKILDFDYSFLSIGDKTGLFKYYYHETILAYIDTREKVFFNKNRQWLELLDLEQLEEASINNMNLLIPNERGELDMISYHRPFVNLSFLELNKGNILHMSELQDLSFWYEKLSLSIGSNSTIWWDEIEVTLDNNGYPLDLDPPMNNRFFSYRITPRFNSLLRDLTFKVSELGGTIKLESGIKKFVTEEGILLDGKIIYQEDIDNGRVTPPC